MCACLKFLRYAIVIVLALLGLCDGGPTVSIASMFVNKNPLVMVHGLRDFPPALRGHSPITNLTVSSQCHKDVVKYLMASLAGETWSVLMLDSDGQIPAGVLQGNRHWIGNYEQCMSVKATGKNITGLGTAKHDFDGRYCRAYFIADKSDFSVGVCVPSTCDQGDVQTLISTGNDSLPIFQVDCSTETHFWRDGRAVTATVVLIFFGTLILCATSIDYCKSRKKQPLTPYVANGGTHTREPSIGRHDGNKRNTSQVDGEVIGHQRTDSDVIVHRSLQLVTIECLDAAPPKTETTSAVWRALLAFSLYRNVPRIINARHAPGSYTCLNGLRVILAGWIVLGHTFDLGINLPVANYNSAAENKLGQYKLTEHVQDQVLILNAYSLGVDGFFILSAAMVTISFTKHLSRQGGIPQVSQMVRYYVHRYLRLTPAYAVVIMLTVGFYRYVAVGPLAPESDLAESCLGTWWSLLLYIDNFVYYYRACLGWTWYLTLDFQYYVIAPLFVWLLYRFPIFGGIFLFLGYAGSLADRLVILRNKLEFPAYMATVYVKPWTRFGPYAIGIALGMIMYQTKCRVRLPKVAVVVGWMAAVCLWGASVYGHYKLPPSPSREYHAYKSTYRDAYSLSIAWLVYACCSGCGGFVNRFLSWNLFIPFSRLTYTFYLIHPVIIFAYTYGRMQLVYVQKTTMVMFFLAHWMLGNMAAFVLSASFELPFMELEKVMFSRKKA